MTEKYYCELNLDLVFGSSDFTFLSDNFHNSIDKLIFESSFWEKAFLCWIKIIIEEKDSSFPICISEKKNFSLSLQIINNKEIAAINQKWMQKNGPTDVLSFPIISNNESSKDLPFLELGDLFISLEMAFKQSLEYNHSIKREMLWLASHGFLHLLGWEHNDDSELDNMLNFQEYLISRLD
tara:strand:+ start:30 stop:572 length:543 start_codon:yes stop_codon:yes gene_type:complete